MQPCHDLPLPGVHGDHLAADPVLGDLLLCLDDAAVTANLAANEETFYPM